MRKKKEREFNFSKVKSLNNEDLRRVCSQD